MTYISPEELDSLRQIDLLTYLQKCEPEELVRCGGQTYCTREHDSLKINEGKWYWFSRGFGGYTALDYLIKVKDFTFIQAVERLMEMTAETPSFPFHRKPITKKKKLLLPPLSNSQERVRGYLMSRGIHPAVIEYCIEHSLLFETADYHNALFVGYDESGVARYGALRSTATPFKGDLTGSDKRFSFLMSDNPAATKVHIFESAIDAMSFASLCELKGTDWKSIDLLSLAGVYQTKRKDAIPVSLEQYLSKHPLVDEVNIHFDNDEVGIGAAVGIACGLPDEYQVCNWPLAAGVKDVNDELKRELRQLNKKEEYER